MVIFRMGEFMLEENDLFDDEYMNDMLLNPEAYGMSDSLEQGANVVDEYDEYDEEEDDDDEYENEKNWQRKMEYEMQKDRELSHIVFEQERLNRRAAGATSGGCCVIVFVVPLVIISLIGFFL